MSRLSGREQAVWDKRNSGLTFKQIAKDLGLCPATVSFAYRKAYRKIEYEKERLKPTELEVYKRALELAEQTIRRICPPIAIGGIVPEHFNDTKDSEYFIEQAEKKLKGDK